MCRMERTIEPPPLPVHRAPFESRTPRGRCSPEIPPRDNSSSGYCGQWWRGLANNILIETVDVLKETRNSQPILHEDSKRESFRVPMPAPHDERAIFRAARSYWSHNEKGHEKHESTKRPTSAKDKLKLTALLCARFVYIIPACLFLL